MKHSQIEYHMVEYPEEKRYVYDFGPVWYGMGDETEKIGYPVDVNEENYNVLARSYDLI